MIFSIRDIPTEGQNFDWSEDHYSVKGFIYPIQNGFDVSGEIDSKFPMECSLCTSMIKIPVHEKFHEIVMIREKPKALNKEEEIHHDDLEISYISGNDLDLRPLIRQVIQVSLPIQPKCVQRGAPEGYPECVADWDYEKYMDEYPEKIKENPFEILNKLKKN